MDDRRFDDLARGWSANRGANRRRLLAGLAGAALGVLGLGSGRRSTAAQAVPPPFGGMICAGPANLPCPPGYGCAQPRMVGSYGTCFHLTGPPAPPSEPNPPTTPCALVRCAAGYGCCDDNGSATCLPAGVVCPSPPPGVGPGPEPNPCATILCVVGTVCCPNCGGVCLPPETPCSDAVCQSESCGPGGAVCGFGHYCCNESCGICAPLRGFCTQQACEAS